MTPVTSVFIVQFRASAHDNARFASGGGDRSVFLWNVTAGTTERRMPGHLGKINAVAFNADASVLASGKPNTCILAPRNLQILSIY
jgi:WD40 repeat protein